MRVMASSTVCVCCTIVLYYRAVLSMQLTVTSPGPCLFLCLIPRRFSPSLPLPPSPSLSPVAFPRRFPDTKVYEPVAADIDIDEELAKIIGQESLKEEIRRYEYGSMSTCFTFEVS